MWTVVPIIFYPVYKNVDAPTGLMFCEMQTPFEETVRPLILVRKTRCVFKMDDFSTGASFSFSLSRPALLRSLSSGCPMTW